MDKMEIVEKLSTYKGLLEKAASTISSLQTQVKESELKERAEAIVMKMMDKGLVEPDEFLAKRAELVENVKAGNEDFDTLERAIDLAKTGGSFVVGHPESQKSEAVLESERIKQQILENVG